LCGRDPVVRRVMCHGHTTMGALDYSPGRATSRCESLRTLRVVGKQVGAARGLIYIPRRGWRSCPCVAK
jgi:hypothetical protein